MKINRVNSISIVAVFAGLVVASALAELGLQQILTGQGTAAADQAVRTAVRAVYANNTDSAVIQGMLRAILVEAETTGNQMAISDVIQSMMQISAEQGAAAVGQAAATAASVVYAGAASTTPEVTQSQLGAILNGAASGGTPPAVLNAAIVSVMQSSAEQGAAAVGQAAATAASVVYAGAASTTPEVTQSQLSTIVGTVAQGGNEASLNGAVVGVLTAGGTQNIDLGVAAINSAAPNNEAVANTIAQTAPLVTNETPVPPPSTPTTPTTPTTDTPPGGGTGSGGGTGGDVGPGTTPVDPPATPV